mmetsp:Transcript_22332/g.32016  ORF Transcript_22332/g.32016 Transcript_22332/m.32016 type:complete len:146 (+) Transcript_22332:996-1433(+)
MNGDKVDESGRELMGVLAEMESRDEKVKSALEKAQKILAARREGVRMLLRRKEQTIEDQVNIRNGGRKKTPSLAETEVNVVPSRKDKTELDDLEKQEQSMADQIVKIEESMESLLAQSVQLRRQSFTLGNEEETQASDKEEVSDE